MKRILAILAVVALAMPALAGEYKRCGQDTQHCLDAMVAHMQKGGYGGVDMAPDEATGSLKVTAVHPGGPAEKLGIQVGDVLVSLNGKKFAEMSDEERMGMEAELTVGSTHKVIMLRKGKEKSFEITLVKMPAEVIAKRVGDHMLLHASVELAEN